jgi:hypothetical protein
MPSTLPPKSCLICSYFTTVCCTLARLFAQAGIDIVFSNGLSFNAMRNDKGNNLANTIFSFRSSYRYNSSVNITEVRSVTPIEQNNIGASTASDIDQRMVDNYRRLQAKYNKYRDDNDVKPSEARRVIIEELNKAISECLNIEITSLGNVEDGKGSIFFQKPDYDKDFSFDVLSSGEKEVIDLLLDLYLRKDMYNDSVYLIDEPELHISTSIQRKLMIEIDKMVGDNCQIWIATHSIGLLRSLQEELRDKSDIIRFDGDKQWAKETYTLKPMEKSRKNWQTLFTTALDDLTALLVPKRIIYCEGRDKLSGNGSDKGMDAQVYNTIFACEYPDTLFISSGGNTELDQRSEIAIAIIGKALPQTDIWVLKDRDMASGKSAVESDRQEYLRLNPDNHRVLKRFEIENYLFDKAVLRKYCIAQGRDLDTVKYDNLNLDIENGDIKSSCNAIKNACGVVGSVNAEIFKVGLASFITTDMPIYAELKAIIFERK